MLLQSTRWRLTQPRLRQHPSKGYTHVTIGARTGHHLLAAANCNANPRCVKYPVPHWTKDCPLTRDSEEKHSCGSCDQHHTANYRGCPKAPKFSPNTKRPFRAPVASPRNLENFPALVTKKTISCYQLPPLFCTLLQPLGEESARPPGSTREADALPLCCPSAHDYKSFMV
ncbi:hypothetical protein EVAR_53534_1 [Eumeta japonica]|uniref:Nucleic-acid-binding protein from transposon X-element n=1 Tax=Eumeta variegata TaxID=151549 RepID=A0A4C1Y5U3_EUMVA|nr:hypothetical protein EVAR_53534_1 [Eumeta japonica]